MIAVSLLTNLMSHILDLARKIRKIFMHLIGKQTIHHKVL
jgi:hypothetical protein